MHPRKLTELALLTTLSLIIYAVESALPPLAPIPGLKLGLANIVTLVVLCNFSGRDALWVLFARILLSALLFGQVMSLIYSLAGGLLSLLFMLCLHRFLRGHCIVITSMAGGVAHNLGQFAAALFLTGVPGVAVYLPFLLLSGILTGLFTGLCAHFLQKYILNFAKIYPKASNDI